MGKVEVHYEIEMSDGVAIVEDISYQRNGISGEGFYQLEFTYWYAAKSRGAKRLNAVLFTTPKHCAVINPLDIEDHWRGDNFEDKFRPLIPMWDELRTRSHVSDEPLRLAHYIDPSDASDEARRLAKAFAAEVQENAPAIAPDGYAALATLCRDSFWHTIAKRAGSTYPNQTMRNRVITILKEEWK